MKRKTLLLVFTLSALITNAQVSYLMETFDGGCATVSGHPSGWLFYSPPSTPDPLGKWICGPTDGRGGTPGVECTGYYSSAPHLDTSFLITPLLDLGSYAGGHVYLNFDSKTTNITLGGKLEVLKTDTTDPYFSNPTVDTFLTGSAIPTIGLPADSTGWVTHHINLSSLIGSGYFYIGFRYTSTTTTGSKWFIDNVNTSTTQPWLNVEGTGNLDIPLRAAGNSGIGEVTIVYSTPAAGACNFVIYDIMGRELHKESLNAHGGNATYTVRGLNLRPGMYFIKMGDGSSYGSTKFIIQ